MSGANLAAARTTQATGRLQVGRAFILALTVFTVGIFIYITWPMSSDSGGYSHGYSRGYSRDISSFRASGRAAAAGQNPYGVYELTHRSEIDGRVVAYPNLNPPISVLAFEALAALPPLFLYRLWYVANLALYALTLWRLARAFPNLTTRRRVCWALCMTGLWSTVSLGQVYILLGAAAAGAWLALGRNRPLQAGLLIGLVVVVKPNLLVWPALLILSGAAVAGWAAVGCAAVLSLLPILRYGPGIYTQWLSAIEGVRWVHLPHNMSLMGVTARLGLPWLGPVLAVALLGALALWAYRRRPPALRASRPAIIASFLASPLAWPAFLVFLIPILWSRHWSRRLAIGALALLVPWLLVVYFGGLSPVGSLVAGLIYPAALVILLVEFVRTR